jgi:hypothetical protein
MNGFSWTMLILAAMIGVFLFATIGVVALALLLGNVSDRLSSSDEARGDS